VGSVAWLRRMEANLDTDAADIQNRQARVQTPPNPT